jgi:hypothetical protein
MPTTITIADPRPRTRRILLDLDDPNSYRIRIVREQVEETTDTGEILRRSVTRTITRTITFGQDGTPAGDAALLPLLAPIQAAVEALEAADIQAEQAAAAAAEAARAAAEAARAAAEAEQPVADPG